RKLGEYNLSLDYYQKILAITEVIDVQEIDKANILYEIGKIYSDLKQHNKALSYYKQALTISRKIYSKEIESGILIEIGKVYSSLKKDNKALDNYQQSLAINRKINHQELEASNLFAIGKFYGSLKKYKKALEYYQQSLEISRKIDDKMIESGNLHEIGNIYRDLGNHSKALDYYQQSLVLSKQAKNKEIVGVTLSGIAGLLLKQKQPELAIVFLKQAVSNFEQIRQGISTLPKSIQESYTKKIAISYRVLADLLIQQDRILEAQQVLDLLKVRELKDYLGDVRGSGEELVILRPEEKILRKYDKLQKSAIEHGQRLQELRKIPENQRKPEQNQEIIELVKLQEELNKQFETFSQSEEVQALLNKLTPQILRQTVDLLDLNRLRDKLPSDAVMLYPLILDDRLELIITTPNSTPLRRKVPVKRTELNKVIAEFRQALQNKNSDAKAPAQKLYNWLIKPLEEDFEKAKTQTIIYAPDGQLRYIPLAALHDGKQWLVEKYRVNNITAKSLTEFDAKPQAQPQVLAGAFVKGNYNVQVTGRNYPFQGLPYAGKEVENLTKILPKTTKLIDKEFSKNDTTVKMNEYNTVHFATHAAFVMGDASLSFILFGDGETANLKEIGNWTLNNVDLVVLSACETGVGIQAYNKEIELGDGKEILGLGYQFQRAGARATIASLWKVSDGGTQVLMNSFYNALKQGQITKAEALRQAQIALINSKYKFVSDERGIIQIVPNNASNSKPASSKLQHPYYWAPFILIGNGL
ncbi:MAG: CHAT domain-containing protein, partial [Cyanobacteria bacterium J06633_8]